MKIIQSDQVMSHGVGCARNEGLTSVCQQAVQRIKMATLGEFMKGKDVSLYRGFVRLEKQWYEYDLKQTLEKFPEVVLEEFQTVILKDSDLTTAEHVPPNLKDLKRSLQEGNLPQLPETYIADNMAVWSADTFCQRKAKILERCIWSRADLMEVINVGQKEIDYLKHLVKKYPVE